MVRVSGTAWSSSASLLESPVLKEVDMCLVQEENERHKERRSKSYIAAHDEGNAGTGANEPPGSARLPAAAVSWVMCVCVCVCACVCVCVCACASSGRLRLYTISK